MTTLERARALAAVLEDAGVPAFVEVGRHAANLPAVLVGPPRLAFDAYGGPTVTWRLIACAADATGSATAWAQLDALLDGVAAVLPVEAAEPIGYAPNPTVDPLPAYALTLTD